MKKLLALLLGVILFCVLVACSTRPETIADAPDEGTAASSASATDNGSSYTVTFDTQGGSTVAAQKVAPGQKVSQPQDPTRAGYVFGGWLCDGETFSFEQAVTQDLALTAAWDPLLTISETGEVLGLFPAIRQVETLEIPAVYEDIAVTSIGRVAFYGCTDLKSVSMPQGLTVIGSNAFDSCGSLTDVVIPDGVTSINASAFYKCMTLSHVSIPDSVTYIGVGAFLGCDRLQWNLYDNAYYLGNEQNPYLALVRALSGSTTVAIHDDTKLICSQAFDLCPDLAELTIPAQVTYINKGAFDGCAQLTELVIPAAVTDIGPGAFYRCEKLVNLTVAAENTVYHSAGNCVIETASGAVVVGCVNSVIPADGTVTSVGPAAFSGLSGLTSITIPASVTNVGASAFSGCTGLTSVTYQGTKAQWSAVEKEAGWNSNTGDYVVHCTDGDLSKSGQALQSTDNNARIDPDTGEISLPWVL